MTTTPLPIDQFAQGVRDKYPGAYDHMSDPELVNAIVTKYPQYKEHIASYAPTQFEKDRPGKGITLEGAGSAAWEGIKGIGKGLVNSVDPTTGLSGAGLTAVGLNPRSGSVSDRMNEVPIVGAAREAKAGWERGRNDSLGNPHAALGEAVLSGAGGLVGESAERARQHADRGEGGAILGEAAVPAAAAIAAPFAGEAAKPLGRSLGRTASRILRDPETGKVTLTPSTIGERIIPQRPEIAAREAAEARDTTYNQKAEDLMRRQTEQDRLDAAHAARLKEVETARQQELADAEKLKEQDAQSRMRRGAQQERIDSRAAEQGKAVPISESPNIANQKWLAEQGKAIPVSESPNLANQRFLAEQGKAVPIGESPNRASAKWLDEQHEAHATRVTEAEKTRLKELADQERLKEQHARSLNARGGVPAEEPGEAPAIRSVGADARPSEGRPATWEDETVRTLAKWGDPDAMAQIQNRMKGGLATPGRVPLAFSTTELSPRSVTRWEGNSPTPVEESGGVRDAFEEAQPAEVPGVTEPIKSKTPPREKPIPVERRFSPEEITDAEGLIQQEIGMMQSADRPGSYFDEWEQGNAPIKQNLSVKLGERAGGKWRGVKSGRNMQPFMSRNPDLNPAQLEKALRNKDSAMYRKAIERAVDFNRRRGGIGDAAEPEIADPGAEEFPFGANQSEAPPIKNDWNAEGGLGRIKTEIDGNGLKWAITPDGKYRVTVPKSIPESEIEQYAIPKLREQAEIHGKLGR